MSKLRPATKLTPPKRAAYVKALERNGELTACAALVGVSRQCIYDAMNRDPEFRDACEMAQGRLDARIMATVDKLACEGTVVYTYGKNGEVATEKRVYDPRIILAWLKRRNRAEWGDKVEVDQTITGHVVTEQRIRVEDMSPEQLAAARAFVATLPAGVPGLAEGVPAEGSE